MWDTSNLFVAAALTGGLVTLILVIAVFQRSFAAIGTARKRVSGDRKQEWFLWYLGSALFALVVASFGIAFLYQSQMLLFVLPALISVATFEAKQAASRKVEGLSEVGVAFASGNAGSDLPLNEGRQESGQAPVRA